MGNSVQGIILLLVCGVFYAVTDEVKSVYEGDSVTLQTDTVIKKDEKILWKHIKKGSFILLVEMIEHKIEYDDSIDQRIRNRLQILDTQTGDLTIKNMRIKHTGVYQAEIQTGTGTSYKNFSVTVKESPRVTDGGASVVKSVSVKEGESVTLHTDEQTQKGDLILWRFGDKNLLIAKGDMEDNKISVYDDDDGRFSGRLKLNDQTGDLTITNIRTSNTGVYNLKIISNRETKYNTFSVFLSEAGWSSGAIAGLVISVLLIIVAAGVLCYVWMSQKEQEKLMDEMKTKEVTEGYPLLLVSGLADMKTDKELSLEPAQIEQRLEETVIEWRFGETLIAEIKRNNDMITQKGFEIFGERLLQLDKRSGDLTIRYISMKHAGLYKVKIIYNKVTSYFLFNVIVKARVRSVALRDSVIIPTGLKQIQDNHKIEWKFKKSPGDELLLAEIRGTSQVISDYSRERFNRRLTVDPNTGDLIINKVTAVDTGLYILHDKTGKRQWNYYVALFVPGKTRDVITLETGGELPVNTKVEWSFSDEVNSKDKRRLVTGMIGHSSDAKNASGTFRGRLAMVTETGDLIITIATFTDAGFYTLKLIKTDGEISYRIFQVDFNELYTALSDDEAYNLIMNKDPQDSARNEPAAAGIPLLSKAEV